ncbi:MAG: hypothetical protein ACK5EA_03975, partial [Planctomycetaceae bacterium]
MIVADLQGENRTDLPGRQGDIGADQSSGHVNGGVRKDADVAPFAAIGRGGVDRPGDLDRIFSDVFQFPVIGLGRQRHPA